MHNVSSGISKHQDELKIQCASEYFDEIQGVWIADENTVLSV